MSLYEHVPFAHLDMGPPMTKIKDDGNEVKNNIARNSINNNGGGNNNSNNNDNVRACMCGSVHS